MDGAASPTSKAFTLLPNPKKLIMIMEKVAVRYRMIES